MAKGKTKKHDTFIDMTAMSDVTVLLLTFFMLTASFKPLEPVEVITPSSVSETKVPDYDVLTILVDTEGKVFLNIDRPEDKIAVLNKMGKEYGVEFTEKQKRAFVEQSHIGVPMNELPKLLNTPSKDQGEVIRKLGIPTDSANNQLADWVRNFRSVNEDASIALKSDRSTSFPHVDKVMMTLVDLKENRYSLVTTLKAMPVGL